ncbi:MAG TPA: FAD-binding protein, partial [Ignavibacteriaceae bacterium]
IGVCAYDWEDKSSYLFISKVVLMASGGAAGVFKRSTNPDSSIGDGISLAYDAGAEITNMEFVQFHPTAFYSESGTTFLLSEALRGEGGYLLNNQGKRFMENYHEAAELAPRDIVSKAIFEEMNNENTDHIFLSLTHLDSNKIKTRFRNLYEKALEFNIDITTDKIPVAPAAHYTVGGINTNLNAETNIKRLFAAGEVAYTGVHGANRLASNSLLECLVFSHRAVDESKKYLDFEFKREYLSEIYYVDSEYDIEYLAKKKKISEIMNQYVGIVRSKESLEKAFNLISDIDKNWTHKLNEYYSNRLRSLKLISLLIINGALSREETRGCHIRLDFPNSDKTLYNILQSLEKGLVKKFV